MQFDFIQMDEAAVREILSWRYDEPYAVYNREDDPSEMLDRRSPHYAVRDGTGKLVGFFCSASLYSHSMRAQSVSTSEQALFTRPHLRAKMKK